MLLLYYLRTWWFWSSSRSSNAQLFWGFCTECLYSPKRCWNSRLLILEEYFLTTLMSALNWISRRIFSHIVIWEMSLLSVPIMECVFGFRHHFLWMHISAIVKKEEDNLVTAFIEEEIPVVQSYWRTSLSHIHLLPGLAHLQNTLLNTLLKNMFLKFGNCLGTYLYLVE